jgi:hypothetical protein
MENDYNKQDREAVFSKRIRAGKRTYFFDVRTTRANDYYLTITESTKRFGEERFVKHKIFLYKEDFRKFMDGLNESVDYIKEKLPDYDFDNPPQRGDFNNHDNNHDDHSNLNGGNNGGGDSFGSNTENPENPDTTL